MGKGISRSSMRICRGEFSLDFTRHDYREIDDYLIQAKSYKRGRKSPIYYLNLSSSFDIEVSSFFRHKNSGKIIDTKKAESISDKELRKDWEKIAIMYAWVFTYNGHGYLVLLVVLFQLLVLFVVCS